MILRFKVEEPVNAGAPDYICNGHMQDVDPTDISCKLTIGNVDILDTADLSSVPAMGAATWVLNNNGEAVQATVRFTTPYVYVDITLLNVWDSVDIIFTVGKANYDSFNNTFRVYGYDLGNDGLVTNNFDFTIKLIQTIYNTSGYPYSSCVFYPKPFSNKYHYYKNSSANYNKCYYLDKNDDIIINSINGEYCSTEDYDIIMHTCILRDVGGTPTEFCCDTLRNVNYLQWFPIMTAVLADCGECDNETCVTTEDGQDVTITLDFTNTHYVYIDDVASPVYIDQVIGYNLINESNQVLDTIREVVYLEYPYSNVTQTWTIYNPDADDAQKFIVRVCSGIVGNIKYPILLGDVEDADYYRILSNLDAADFSNCSTPVNLNINWDPFQGNGSVTPTTPYWSTSGSIAKMICTGSIPADNFYKIYYDDFVLGSDFSNITGIPGSGNSLNRCFYLATATTPISWGTAPLGGYYGNFSGGGILEVTPVVICCIDLELWGCALVSIAKDSCNGFTLRNRSNRDTASYSLSILTDGVFVEVDTGSIDANSDQNITDLDDGVYTVTITIGEETFTYIVVIYCAIEACYLAYLNKLMCCNTETNCSSALDSKCREKDYYDFNAFSILMHSFFSMLNHEYVFNFAYDTITDSHLAELVEINTLLERAEEYCLTCEKPCNEITK